MSLRGALRTPLQDRSGLSRNCSYREYSQRHGHKLDRLQQLAGLRMLERCSAQRRKAGGMMIRMCACFRGTAPHKILRPYHNVKKNVKIINQSYEAYTDLERAASPSAQAPGSLIDAQVTHISTCIYLLCSSNGNRTVLRKL